MFDMSLIHNRDNNGPKIDPWGTPQFIRRYLNYII